MAQSHLKQHTEGKGHGCFRLEAVGSGILAVPRSAEKPKVRRELISALIAKTGREGVHDGKAQEGIKQGGGRVVF